MAALNLAPADVADDLSRYIHPAAGGERNFEIAVKGAHCAGCIAKIEGGVKGIAGVSGARLNLSTGKLSVTWKEDAVKPQMVLRRVRDLGYEAQPFEAPAVLDAEAREGRMLLRCLAVSGFGTVFIMGLTDAIWYGADLSSALRQSFFWLAAAVSVPVTLYAGQVFFLSAWSVLRQWRTNMDVPISLALLLALGLSLYQTSQRAHDTYFDAAVMLTFLLLVGRYLDYRLRDRARGAARHLLAMQSLLAQRVRSDGGLETVAARELAPGDHIFLATGERLPVNGTLLERNSEADLSLVTGETMPVSLAASATLLAGSIITGVPATLLVTARVEDSLVADLARLLEAGQQTRNRYVNLAEKAARAYVPLVTGLALLVFVGWLLAGAGLEHAVTSAITVLIITCPCALGLAVPAVQVAATSRLFRKGVFVKSGNALERLAEIDVAVFDKTGTLTLGKPVLENGAEIAPDLLQRAALLARGSRHPLARALAEAAGPGPVASDLSETAGAGLEAAGRRLGNAAWCGVASVNGGSELWFRDGNGAPIAFLFHDQIRPETKAVVKSLKMRGIEVEMLTGDRTDAAGEIAREAGIALWNAEVGPAAKALHMKSYRAGGRRTLMVGDGLNDTAALALAHVSVAPGTAAEVSQLAADFVLRGDSLEPLIDAIDVSRKAKRLVLQNFAMAALYNLTAIPLAAFGLVSPLVAAATMAGSSLLVTLNALRLVRP
jgi:Cu2+-exporting ATPase